MPPSGGKYMHCIAPAATMVINFSVKNQVVRCDFAASKASNQTHKNNPLLCLSKQKAAKKRWRLWLELKISAIFLAIKC
jgi:hypothetical protein